MYRLAVGQQDHSQVSVFHFHNLRPPPNSTVGLTMLANRSANDKVNPLITDQRTVCPKSDRSEIGGDFHPNNLPDLPKCGRERPNDQVERRADATPAQKAAMNRHVRSNAGLGGVFT